MHCQKETAQAIRDKGADYVLTVKRNQPKVHAEIQKCFEDAGEKDYDVPGMRRLKKTERGHGRIEHREYYVMPAPKSLRDTGDWADLRTVGMVYRERELRDKDSHEVVFFISSLPVSVTRLAKHLRGHWGIENSLHWSLDVTFGEDKNRTRRGNAPEIAGALRRQCSLDPQAGHFSEKVLDSRQETPGRNGATMSSKEF